MERRPILVGVDFRQPSLAAARWAATHFANRARIEVLHVNPVPETPSFLGTGFRPSDDADVSLRPKAEGLRGFVDTLPAGNVSGLVRVGEEVAELSRRARVSRASLVVLGGAKASAASGRTLHRVIRNVGVPAIVVGPEGGPAPRRILVALDDAAIADTVLHWSAELAREFDARLILLHALPAAAVGDVAIRRTHAWMRQMHERIEGAPLAGRTTVAVGQAGPVLLEHARAIRADLIVMGRNGKHAAGPTELGATAKLLLRAAHVPVAIIPPAKPRIQAAVMPEYSMSMERLHVSR